MLQTSYYLQSEEVMRSPDKGTALLGGVTEEDAAVEGLN